MRGALEAVEPEHVKLCTQVWRQSYALDKKRVDVEVSSEEIVQQILEFVYEKGRLPKHDEPGFEDMINAAIKTFGSLEDALRIAGVKF
jgi:hypothetical protein